jgi:hypothetical protein
MLYFPGIDKEAAAQKPHPRVILRFANIHGGFVDSAHFPDILQPLRRQSRYVQGKGGTGFYGKDCGVKTINRLKVKYRRFRMERSATCVVDYFLTFHTGTEIFSKTGREKV